MTEESISMPEEVAQVVGEPISVQAEEDVPQQGGDDVEVEASETIDPLNNPQVNQAAKDFGEIVPRIRALSKNMGRNSLARVYSAVIEFPLGEKYPNFKQGTKEQELFMISLHALGAKNIMHQAIMQNQQLQEQLHDEIVDGVVEEMKENEDVVEENRTDQGE